VNEPLVLKRADLDRGFCARPGCDHTAHDGLVVAPRCHPRAAVVAVYREGVLIFRCARCTQYVTTVAVAW
jgi:hypothetical protein